MFVTSCGQAGRIGPTMQMCRTEYGQEAVHSHVTDVIRGVQKFRVPATGTWRITAYGAAGGRAKLSGLFRGGLGAEAFGTFELTAGQMLNIVVGQSGSNIHSNQQVSNFGGGGGGGSYVWLDGAETPMIIAGGGGGASEAYQTTSRYDPFVFFFFGFLQCIWSLRLLAQLQSLR